MVIGFVIITAKSGQRDAVLREYQAVIPQVLEEKGCIKYVAATDYPFGPPQTPLGDDSFVIVEMWASNNDFGVHARAEHMEACRARVRDLVVDRTFYFVSPA